MSKDTNTNTNNHNVTSIDDFLKEYKILKRSYDKAQKILAKEKRTDNELYMECLSISGKCIKFLSPILEYLVSPCKSGVEKKSKYFAQN